MAEHVAAVTDGPDPETGNGPETANGTDPGTETLQQVEDREVDRELHEHEVTHELNKGTPPVSGPPDGESVRLPHKRFPLNSKRLTALHLRALARALELPITGSADQLRQCIEAVVARDHEYQNVVVTVRETLKMECVVALTDSDGEFVVCDPVYRVARRVHFEEEAPGSEELRQQLDEVHRLLESAVGREREQAQQIDELQDLLRECEVQATDTCDELRQKLDEEKERARASWQSNCESLAQQDTVIGAQDEKIASLRRRITQMEGMLSSHRDAVRVSASQVAQAHQRDSTQAIESSTTRVMLPPHRRVSPPLATDPPHVSSHEPRHCEHSGVASDYTTQQAADTPGSVEPAGSLGSDPSSTGTTSQQQRRGKAPPY